MQRLIDDQGTVDLGKGLFPGLFDLILETTPWESNTIEMYGKVYPVPRLTAWYGGENMTYIYSGISNKPNPWASRIHEMKRQIEKLTGEKFNSCLLNLYRDGNDGVSWHADNEPELGPCPVIASVSLGGPRKFQLKKRKESPTDKKQRPSILLEDGDLLVMGGDLQKHWLHQIPKTKMEIEPRINLTFRYYHAD